MGKNVKKKKIDYGGMAEEVISTTENESTLTPTDTQKKESTVTPTLTPTYAPAHLPRSKNGERKTERLQLTVRPSTKSRLAKYAEDHNTSSNEVVQILLDDLLDRSGY